MKDIIHGRRFQITREGNTAVTVELLCDHHKHISTVLSYSPQGDDWRVTGDIATWLHTRQGMGFLDVLGQTTEYMVKMCDSYFVESERRKVVTQSMNDYFKAGNQ